MSAVLTQPTARIAPGEVALLAAVFVIAACGLVYELAAGALDLERLGAFSAKRFTEKPKQSSGYY